MRKTVGSILTIGGLIFLIYTGINYLNDSESFGFLGMDVVVSKGNLAPVIAAAAVLVIGVLLLSRR